MSKMSNETIMRPYYSEVGAGESARNEGMVGPVLRLQNRVCNSTLL